MKKYISHIILGALVFVAIIQFTVAGTKPTANQEQIEKIGPEPSTNAAYRYNWIPVGSYSRFNLFVDEPYLLANETALLDYFAKFVPRLNLLETVTGWSAEKSYGTKLKIYVYESTGCYGGRGDPADTELSFSNPMYMPGCLQWGESEELGNTWRYMALALHEVTHSICPEPISKRHWLSEGWAKYNEYNILVEYGDMSQTTADNYILTGGSYYDWNDYVANDYHDNSPNQYEIQSSAGYEIPASMFTMLRNIYGLNWADFHTILNNNPETLTMAFVLGGGGVFSYYTDTFIIYLFGRALGKSFAEIQAIFRYDGPGGPGWGVRIWESIDWLADMSPTFSFSNYNPKAGDNVEISALIHNYNVILQDVSIRFYVDDELIDDQTVAIGIGAPTPVSTNFTRTAGTYTVRVVADKEDIKVETDETNNEAIDDITFGFQCGDLDGKLNTNILDIVYLINYKYKYGPRPVCEPITICADVNSDRLINILDIVFLINYKYKDGPEPTRCS